MLTEQMSLQSVPAAWVNSASNIAKVQESPTGERKPLCIPYLDIQTGDDQCACSSDVSSAHGDERIIRIVSTQTVGLAFALAPVLDRCPAFHRP